MASLLYSVPLLLLLTIPHPPYNNRTKHHQGFLNYSIFQKMTPPYRPLKRPKSEPVFFWKWQLWPLRPIRLWPPLVMAPCFLPWGANVWTQSVIIIVVVPKLGSFFPAFRLVVNGFSIYLYFVVLKMYKNFPHFI